MSKYPYIPQIDARDCEVAALSMLLKKDGTNVFLVRLRDLAKTNQEGTTALGIEKQRSLFILKLPQ